MVEMLGQMKYLPRWFQYYGGLADKIEGSVPPTDKVGMFNYVVHEPIGVVGAITRRGTRHSFDGVEARTGARGGQHRGRQALRVRLGLHARAGAAVRGSGLPEGCRQRGDRLRAEAGRALVEHPLVERIAFTGSDLGGAKISEAAGRQFKRVSLELGGKSPHIVFADADIDAAVKGVISGIFAAAGQTCMAGSRLLLHASIHDAFVEKLVARMREARLGDPRAADTDVGPIATEPQLAKVLDYIEIAKAEGARCVLGGKRASDPRLGEGWFVEPTIFTGVTNQMRIAREEVFGPLLSIMTFETDDEAVAIANDTPYGLAAGFWTTDLGRALNLPRRLRAGTVWVNAYRVVSYLAPFGGFKNSGIGRRTGSRRSTSTLRQRASLSIQNRPSRTRSLCNKVTRGTARAGQSWTILQDLAPGRDDKTGARASARQPATRITREAPDGVEPDAEARPVPPRRGRPHPGRRDRSQDRPNPPAGRARRPRHA